MSIPSKLVAPVVWCKFLKLNVTSTMAFVGTYCIPRVFPEFCVTLALENDKNFLSIEPQLRIFSKDSDIRDRSQHG